MRLVLAALPLLSGCLDFDAPMDPSETAVLELDVPRGATASGLGPQLTELGLVPSELHWKLFLRSTEAGCVKAGRHHVSRSLSTRQVLETLCGAPLPEDVPYTVLEGWRIRDIDADLAAKGWIEAGEYTALATSKEGVNLPFEITSSTLEGYLFPETYLVLPPPHFEPRQLIERQLETFQERFLAKHGDALGDRSLHEVVVMASMLEREEPSPSQRPIVAGILWKRLDNGWQLGVDATSRYELEDWNDRRAFLKRLRDEDDPYNTRIHKGLPPTAIGNPVDSALEAALQPETSPYWFYLHDHEGVFHGAVDAAGHEANRARYNVY